MLLITVNADTEILLVAFVSLYHLSAQSPNLATVYTSLPLDTVAFNSATFLFSSDFVAALTVLYLSLRIQLLN